MTTAVIMGRFNLPTTGHANLIASLADTYDNVMVILSTATQTDLIERTMLLDELVDCNNVVYRSAPNMYRAFEAYRDQPDTYLIGGEDRGADIQQLAVRFNLGYHVAPRTDGMSSTFIRGLVDSGDLLALREYYEDEQILTIQALRAEELA